MAAKLEVKITLEECFASLNAMGKEKSLDWDGLTIEFFLEFWEHLKLYVLFIVNRDFLQGKLHPGVLTGLVRLIPKQDSCSLLKY